MVRSILIEGAEKAEDDARQTLNEVRQAMGLSYR
jgi:tryptophanyl-tRNA synthetase